MDERLDTAGTLLPGHVAVGALTHAFPPALVDEAVQHTGRRELRKRRLPARITVYFTLGLWLWPGLSYGEVLRRVVTGLAWCGIPARVDAMPTSGSLAKARERLGPEPLRVMSRLVCEQQAAQRTDVRYAGLRVSRIEEDLVRALGTPANLSRHDSPAGCSGGASTAHVRLAAQLGPDGALQGASTVACCDEEASPGRDLLLRADPGSLLLMGPARVDRALSETVTANGSHLLWGLSEDTGFSVLDRLEDGTHIATASAPGQSGGPGTRFRLIGLSAAADPVDGPGTARRPICLATTLLDPQVWPAEELLRLYPLHWSDRTVLDTIAPWSAEAPLLRSQKPDGVDQELWALLCVYQALSCLRSPAPWAG